MKAGVGDLDYDAGDLLWIVERAISDRCLYCRRLLTPKNFTIDHRIPIARGGSFYLDNLALCCKPCNYQKGALRADEFVELLEFLDGLMGNAAEDIKRRLTVGGRWSPK
jgi:HNH endonuclease